MKLHSRHYEPGVAFRNKFPEVIPDLEVYKGIRFFDNLISFGFTCCISLPLFYRFPQLCDDIFPAGVVQCCMKKRTGLLVVFNQLKSSLVSLGLQTYPILPPYKNIDAIKPASDEIKEALEIVCQSYHLPLAQVWILNHKHSYIPYSSPPPFKEQNSTRGLFVFKLCGYLLSDDVSLFSSVIKDYYDTCDAVPLRLGDGLVGKTLETRQPRFCRNIDKLRMNGVFASLSGSTECTCLVICLRSIHTTDDVDYAFEFLWPKTRDYLTLMESLLLTLNTCLPNFKLPSGAQLRDMLHVLDVDASTSFNLLQQNMCSLIPKALEKQPLLHGEQGPTSKKRKLGDFFETDSKCVVQTDSDLSPEENSDVFILAAYKENVVRVITRTSNTLSYARKIIEESFNLDRGTYSMEYEFEGERASMDTDQDLDCCIKLWTSSLKRRGRKGHIVVLVSTP
ncbi:hypothetical protein Tco_1061430 [Tanacetum coccineum]